MYLCFLVLRSLLFGRVGPELRRPFPPGGFLLHQQVGSPLKNFAFSHKKINSVCKTTSHEVSSSCVFKLGSAGADLDGSGTRLEVQTISDQDFSTAQSDSGAKCSAALRVGKPFPTLLSMKPTARLVFLADVV